ncbi:hypothetical protein [Bradyrhizobium valentinum]|uniref:Uncharacterized protein n=1 Tax=Bradyrhizobium valentinum TaxID=1518501 RepID=A0A0R3KKW0_9BRAD|nr:hypothetical protein [Bradyrhizobium valentinum]KRQ96361.1 hypothetical protein CQ10_30890 [Bradyrhizobium valentinum]KRR04746.1 hypothetical protein CP49_18790 [Bradyrhizobium valentinum]
MARKENDKLNTIGGGASKLRLACEVKLLGTGSMIIELFGFGSGFFKLGREGTWISQHVIVP